MSVYIKKADKLSIQMDTNQDKILIDISSVSLIYVSESMIVRMSIKLNYVGNYLHIKYFKK